MGRLREAARKQELLRAQVGCRNPVLDSVPGLFREFEPNGLVGLALDHGRSGDNAAAQWSGDEAKQTSAPSPGETGANRTASDIGCDGPLCFGNIGCIATPLWRFCQLRQTNEGCVEVC